MLIIINPNDVIAQLEKIGVKISRKTLYNWEQWGLIPYAKFRNSRTTEYPDGTVQEAYAASFMMNGIPLLGNSLKFSIAMTRGIREFFFRTLKNNEKINRLQDLTPIERDDRKLQALVADASETFGANPGFDEKDAVIQAIHVMDIYEGLLKSADEKISELKIDDK